MFLENIMKELQLLNLVLCYQFREFEMAFAMEERL